MWYVVCFVAGLIVGWNVLPQPAWMKALYDRTGPAGSLVITGIGGAYWVCYVNGVAQSPSHSQQFEAVQHADALRWANPDSVMIEIKHNAVYNVQ
jgi:hypothetical protein